MRALRSLALVVVVACSGLPALAQEPISNLPRNQTLIVENPEGTIKNAGWFNIWAVNAGGQSTGLHQLARLAFLPRAFEVQAFAKGRRPLCVALGRDQCLIDP